MRALIGGKATVLLAIMLGLVTGGCAAGNWMGGPAAEMNSAESIKWSVTINQHQVTITVPGGGREFFQAHPGPLQVGRTEQATFDATSIFTREYGRSSMGSDYGAFRISVQTVNIPVRLPKAPDDINQLKEFIQSGSSSSSKSSVVGVQDDTWVKREVPNSLYGYLELYTRKLDDDVLISLSFDLDRARLPDAVWHQARQRDIETILRSVRITPLK
ncbi:MAG TPA: hypothetical protein VIE67_07770 [Rudaea sp.]|jgi:hypothetical protein|uniref:hypothetical protein n=1 Tax=Rudaea sp. TaxID=2136325 RepID=UPI002F920D91